MKLCECGCGEEVTKEGNRYLKGHYWRGKTHTDEAKAKISTSMLGKVAWNKGKTGVFSEESLAKMSTSSLGQVVWNKGKTFSEEAKIRMSKASTYNLKKWQEKCPLLSKVEEMKEIDGKIYVHCTNHNCPNSKELGGFFTPTGISIASRTDALNNGDDWQGFYCSESCKKSCIKFHKSAASLIKQDKIAAGHIEEPLHTPEEYSVWREEVLKLQRDDFGCNECVYCGNKNMKELVVHHEKPQKTHPEMSLDPDNGVICCGANSEKKCHYKYGHKTGTKCSTGNLANRGCI